jgi:hypothetical protein
LECKMNRDSKDVSGPPQGNQSGPRLICGVSVLASAL